jgi:hypothetical protein
VCCVCGGVFGVLKILQKRNGNLIQNDGDFIRHIICWIMRMHTQIAHLICFIIGALNLPHSILIEKQMLDTVEVDHQ